MATKVVFGLSGAIFVISILMFDQSAPWILNFCVSFVNAFCVYEFFCALGLKSKYLLTLPSVLFAFLVPLFSLFTPILNIKNSSLQFFCYFYVLAIATIVLFNNKYAKFKDVVVVCTMTMLVSCSLNTLILLRNLGGKFGAFFVLLSLSIAWLSDTGAYLGGSFFGKQKLCPDISPKKTVEGMITGILISFVFVLLMACGFKNFALPKNIDINYFRLGAVCISGSLISLVGDLFFSWVKRGCKIKDFGDVMPGHGGMLDRFDSIIFISPFTYYVIKLFGILQ